MRSILLLIAIGAAAVPRGGQAQERPGSPAVRLAGDPALIAAVRAALADRGIATGARAAAAADVRLERRGSRIAIAAALGGGEAGGPVWREVSDARTAATVIESLVRTDVEAPLLSVRPVDPAPAAPPPAPRGAFADEDDPPPAAPAATVAAVPAERGGRGLQLFALAETSRANDRTSWIGVQVGACVMLGPVCAGARVRSAVVAAEPWPADIDRRGFEVLLGADWPLRLGRVVLSPGVGAGVGSTHTHQDGSRSSEETGGPHADAHVGLSYPLGARTAIEATFALDVTQTTHVETSSPVPLPDEPRLFARFAAGVRFGAL
jgi:hypothetical protein